MTLGINSYGYLWRMSDRVPEPMSLLQVIRDVAEQGLRLFQICDHPPLADAGDEELAEIESAASTYGVGLELGTKGTAEDHLLRYLHIARRLDARLVRSMWTDADDRPDRVETERRLRAVLPHYRDAGVVLALETYEQVPTAGLVDVVAAVDSPWLGICLDPANTVANLELPDDVTTRCAPYVKNWHVKDFDFVRSPGWVGFSYTGVPIGTGRLDYDGIRAAIRPEQNKINQIIEFWLSWQGTAESTVRTEARWTTHAIEYLRSKQS